MRLTPTQFRYLAWLRDHDGVAFVRGQKVVSASGDKLPNAASVTFLHLIAGGAVAGAGGGQLVITDYGRRLVAP